MKSGLEVGSAVFLLALCACSLAGLSAALAADMDRVRLLSIASATIAIIASSILPSSPLPAASIHYTYLLGVLLLGGLGIFVVKALLDTSRALSVRCDAISRALSQLAVVAAVESLILTGLQLSLK